MATGLIDRIQQRLDTLGLKPATASKLATGDPDTIRNIKRGRSANPQSDTMRKLAVVLKTTEEWLLTGSGQESPEKERAHDTSKNASSTINEIDMRAGAGGGGVTAEALSTTANGITIATEAVAARWEIPEPYLRGELRIEPSKAWIVEIMGDSGYNPEFPSAPGSLFPGDRVIIDTSDQRPTPPGLFAIYDGNGLVVKMVEIVHGSDPVRFRLASRNPSYSIYEVTVEEARIVGRIRGRISSM